MQEFVSVWVQDPQLHKEDFWHMYFDYDICLHTNSMCFCKKRSSVRRRYSEFVWLRQRLRNNALLIHLPKLPPANPFFSLNNVYHYVYHLLSLPLTPIPLLLSDSCLHLFLQSQLSITSIDACVQGRTRYTVAQAIQCGASNPCFPIEESKSCRNSDCELTLYAILSVCFCSTSSSGLGIGFYPATPMEMSPDCGSPAHQFLATPTQPEPFKR
uniref:PX domain-containing protein n=1 Tax=Electrophorus electricus TaxID=8005 RepID=A0A4W4DTZ3_ELEEL